MQSGRWLTLFSTKTHLNLNPVSFPAELQNGQMVPSLYFCMGISSRFCIVFQCHEARVGSFVKLFDSILKVVGHSG